MSRLYEALTAIERSAPRVLARVDLPAARPVEARRRSSLVVILCGIVVVVAVAGLAVAFRAWVPSSQPVSVIQAVQAPSIQALPPGRARETLGESELRERAREAAALGSLDQAEELLERALALDRTDALVWNDLGVVLVRRGERRRGIEAFQKSLALDARHAGTHRNFAVALDQDGQVSMAATHYRAFLSLAPQHPERAQIERRLASSRQVEDRP